MNQDEEAILQLEKLIHLSKALMGNPKLAIIITIGNEPPIGISNNENMKIVLKREIVEVVNFMNNKPNTYE
ncbi:MAG: hypothetical protein ACTSQF_00055 [Candidatus Heimdallarchaeaceae archaeon]